LLLAEDDIVVRTVLTASLGSAGYHVTVATNGEQALAFLHEQGGTPRFAVVVSDIGLGDYNGIDVLTAARALPQPPEVILLTGYGRMEIVIEALRGGACDFLEKPINIEAFLSAVGRAVERYQSEQRRVHALRSIMHGLALLQTPEEDEAPPHSETPPISHRYVAIADVQIDTFTRSATYRSGALHLTPTEYTLLLCLAEAPGRILCYDELARRVYTETLDPAQARTLLKGHVYNLRTKLPSGMLRAVRGVGYVLEAQATRHA
jgi:DNA-binding response OmpR family regulator